MFDKFSDQARHVVVLASDAARTHHHNHLGEHLLTGIHAAGGPTGATLGNHRPPPRHRSRRDPRLPEHRPRMCRSPLHPDPEKTLAQSLREASLLGHDTIGTEHPQPHE